MEDPSFDSSSSESSSSSTAGLEERYSRPVVQSDVGPAHPRYFKDYPFVETVAGGDQTGGSTLLATGHFAFRADIFTVPSAGGFAWNFGVNYQSALKNERDDERPMGDWLGPGFLVPQNIGLYPLRDGSLGLVTGEFTYERYDLIATATWGGQSSRSVIKYDHPSNSMELLSSNGTKTTFSSVGGAPPSPVYRADSIVTRFGWRQTYVWNYIRDQLLWVKDPYGRIVATYNYDTNPVPRLTSIDILGGRRIDFQYDDQRRLVAVIGPSVTNAAAGNSFPNGTAHVFRYDENGRIKQVYFPKEVQLVAGAFSGRHVDVSLFGESTKSLARYKVEYDADGRVMTEEVGDLASGIGGKYRFRFVDFGPGGTGNPYDPADPIRYKTYSLDRNGNEIDFSFNARGLTVLKHAATNRHKVSSAPAAYETWTAFNAQCQPTRVQFPLGNSVNYTYDSGVRPGFSQPYRPARGLLKSVEQIPGPRGGSGPSGGVQNRLLTRYFYEPLFNELFASIPPCGNPVNGGTLFPPQNGGGPATAARYATIYTRDYQEDTLNGILGDNSLQQLLRLSSTEINSLIQASNVELGIIGGLPLQASSRTDLNGDGVPSVSLPAVHRGSVIKVQHPQVRLIGTSDIVQQGRDEIFTYNQRGQVNTRTDSEGNVMVVARFPYYKPDGVNSTAGQALVSQYGFVSKVWVGVNPNAVIGRVGLAAEGDLVSFTLKVVQNPEVQPASTAFPDLLSEVVAYDDLGNAVTVKTPRGFQTSVARTNLGEPYLVTGPAPYSFTRTLKYDANRNLVSEQIADRQPFLSGQKQFSPEAGAGEWTANVPMLGFGVTFTNSRQYDLLDNCTGEAVDAAGSNPSILVTAYVFDANQNVILVRKPEGNTVEYDYDERDLRIATRAGGSSGPVWVHLYDGNGNIQEELTPDNFGGSGTAGSVTIAQAFKGPNTPFTGDRTTVEYDGFDRALAVTDSVGGQVLNEYDPEGRLVSQLKAGTVGGASPTDRDPDRNLVLNYVQHRYDEAGRLYEVEQSVRMVTGGEFENPSAELPSGREVVQRPGGLARNSTAPRPPSEVVQLTGTPADESYTLTRTVYDRSGRVYQGQDDNRAIHTSQYDGAGRRVSEDDPLGNTAEYVYDANGNVTYTKVTEITDEQLGALPETFESRAWHDVMDRPVVMAHQGKDGSLSNGLPGYGSETLYTLMGYDSRGNTVVSIDPKRNAVQSTYDGASRLLRTDEYLYVDGDGSKSLRAGDEVQTFRTLDGNGRLAALKDANNNSTGFAYDALDRLKTITFPDGRTRTFAYTKGGPVAVYTDEEGFTFTCWSPGTVSGVDALGRITRSVVNGGSGTTTEQSFQYDGLSRRTRAVDTGSNGSLQVDRYYDSLGRVVEEGQSGTSALANTPAVYVTRTSFRSYVPDDMRYPNDRLVHSAYDGLYRRTTAIDRGAAEAAGTWRFFGPSRVADFRLGNGVRGTHLNDAGTHAAVQSDVHLPHWGDACGDRLGYDGAGRLIGKRYFPACGSSSSSGSSGSSGSSSSLSSGSSPSSFTSSSGSSLFSSLTASSNLPTSSNVPMSSTGPLPGSSTQASIAPSSSSVVSNPSSSASSLSSLSSGSSGSSGSSRSSSSDSSSSSGCNCPPTDVWCDLLAGFTAAYDKSGNKLFERHLHAECRSFLYPSRPSDSAYDSLDRLLAYRRGLLSEDGEDVQTHLALPGVDSARRYNLDKTGNWVDDGLSGDDPAVVFHRDCGPERTENRQTNNLNQVVKDGLTYDKKGNLLTDGKLTLTYDVFSRLTRAQGKGPDGKDVDVTFAYDALNRRVLKKAADKAVRYLLDGVQVVEERGGDNGVFRQYVWGQYVDELVQQREYEHASEHEPYSDWYPMTDLLHRMVALTDDRVCDGVSSLPFGPSLVEVYDTDPYGRTRAYKRPGPGGRWFDDDDERTFEPRCRYLFTGREYDAETGLYYYRARYYHPDLGRFVSRDPLLYEAGDMNLYAYCRANPVAHTDPSGEIIPVIIAGAILLYLVAYGVESNTSRNSGWNKAARFTEGVIEGAAIAAAGVGIAFLAPALAPVLAVAGVIGLSVGISELIAGNDFSGDSVDRWNLGGQLVGGIIGGGAATRGLRGFASGKVSAGNARIMEGGEFSKLETFIYNRSNRFLGANVTLDQVTHRARVVDFRISTGGTTTAADFSPLSPAAAEESFRFHYGHEGTGKPLIRPGKVTIRNRPVPDKIVVRSVEVGISSEMFAAASTTFKGFPPGTYFRLTPPGGIPGFNHLNNCNTAAYAGMLRARIMRSPAFNSPVVIPHGRSDE